ncbi:MAG: hypothetical protein H0T73_12235, partial [Ardenticatenales bacterium]|nr:hypothetical protein [Ardenticatenales bacterium]
RQEGGSTILEVTSMDEDGRPVSASETRALIVGPDLEPTELTNPQVGAGQYRAELPTDDIGAYFIAVTQQDESGEIIGGSSRGFVVPYSPEYRLQQTDETLLGQVAERTGGVERTLGAPAEVFEHPPQQVTRAEDLWPWLLLLALLLFPFDVAARRVMFGQREVEAARAWIDARRQGTVTPRAEPMLGTLFEAKQRASRRDTATGEESTPAMPARPAASGPVIIAPRAPTPTEPPASDASGDEDSTLSRLREAKQRRTRK